MSSKDSVTVEVPKEIEEHTAYIEWENNIDGSILQRVQSVREKIEAEGLITNVKNLGDGLYEKKWTSGLRLYFAVIKKSDKKTLLLLGSGKGDQNRIIPLVRKTLKKYLVVKENIIKKN